MFSAFFPRQIDNSNPPVLALIGDGSVGKTSLKNRLTTPKREFRFNPEYVASDGVNFVKIKFATNYGVIDVCLEDTPGQEKFDSVRSGIVKGADMCIIMYDCVEDSTYLNVKNWLKYLYNCQIKPSVLVMGNKLDEKPHASMHKTTHIRKAQLKQYYNIDDHNLRLNHIEVSIKEKTNLKAAFETLLRSHYRLNDLVIKEESCAFKL